MVNKTIVNKLSMESAVFIAILADANDIFDGGWIYQTEKTVEAISHGFLTRRRQETAIRELLENKLIEKKLMGIPCKRYFKLNKKEIIDFISI